MILRPQTVRRLLVLFAAVMVMVGIGAGLYWRNEHRKSVRLAEARDTGMKAFAAGDYQGALDSLKYYVARDQGKNDAEALYAYGMSRSRIEDPNGKHIFEGIAVFNAVLALDPMNLDARHRLLDLYTQAWRNEETLDLAEKVLSVRPEDREALKAKSMALERLRRFDGALAASQKLNELDPKDLDQQLVTYELMRKLKRPPETLVARATQQQRAHPDDPRFMMLLGMAYGNAGDAAQGRDWLTRAAERPAPDATFVHHMVRVLDTLKMYPQSQKMLDRVTQQSDDPLIVRVVVQRLWQNGQNARVLERLADVDPADPKADTGLLAYRALAAFESGRQDEGRRIVAALNERRADSEAIAWATALKARFNPTEPRAALQQYQAALVREPDNAVIRFLVGEAYARLGETELAIASWRRAAELSPSWATPRVDAARTLAGSGRLKEAIAEAQAAVRAAPTQLAPIITLAAVRHKALEEGAPDGAEEARLLKLVEQIQKVAPGEAETLPVYVNLLAKAGRRNDAIASARKVLADPKKYNQATLLRLVSVSRSHKLGLEEELQSASAGGDETPRVALARAADLAAAGKPLDGLKLLQSRADSATTQPVAWNLALVQYKEAIRHPSAKQDWIALGDAHPSDLAVQSAVLKIGASARADRAFTARSIERLKTLTGAEGQTWKLERARWLLGGDGGKDTAEAVNILNEIVRTSPSLTEARILLALAYEAADNPAAAIKELQAAAEQDANDTVIAIELSRLLQAQARFADARTYLERAANSPELTEEACRRIAAMLAAQGDVARGVRVLESVGPDLGTHGQLLLAELYRRQQRSADAQRLFTRLLAQQPLELDTVRAAADFHGAEGKLDEARKVLARLPETKPRPGLGELIVAAFNERYGAAADAQRHYGVAVAAAPMEPAVWRQFVAFHLRGERYEEARRTADQGLSKLPDDEVLQRLRTAADALVELSSQDPALRPALATLAGAVADDRGASELLTRFTAPPAAPATASTEETTSSTRSATAGALLARLKELSARYPRSLPLQTALMRLHVALRQVDEAATSAARTMDAFPTDPDAARVAAITFRALGRLKEAAAAAQKWRERSPENPRPADLLLAEIFLGQGEAAAALKQLAPYAEQLKREPKANWPMLSVQLRAVARSGREAQAKAILEPMLAQEAAARVLWLQLAGSEIADADTATAWVKQVAPLMVQETREQMALAGAWYNLAVHHRTEGAAEAAAQVLEQIILKPNAPAEAFLLRGGIADRAGDAKAAEAHYRRGLAMNPDSPEASNNLAYLILLRGGDLAEAEGLAAKAVALAPATPGFHDTLGRILARQGRFDAAIDSFQRALKLQPNNPEALIGLGTALSEAGKLEPARDVMSQIDAVLQSRPPLSAQVRRELEALRATMKAAL